MKSYDESLRQFLQGTKVFQLPVYQRNYNWQKKHVDRFLDDVESLMETREEHFLGVIVDVTESDSKSGVNIFTIIDGQQRLTTAMLFLKALHDLDKDIANEIWELYLTNPYVQDEKNKIKLHLIEHDQESFSKLLKNPNVKNPCDNISTNYSICRQRIKKWLSKGKKSKTDILNAIGKLQIIRLDLTENDDPQLIFESINSTGLELSTSDLIRNFLLMNVKPHEEQYRFFKEYWIPIAEKNLHGDNKFIDDFFRSYIIYKKQGTLINKGRPVFYGEFKKIVADADGREGMFIELERFSRYFEAFKFSVGNYSETTKKYLSDLRELNQTTCYPFLFKLFDDYDHELIDEMTLEAVLKLIISYYVQFLTCNLKTNGHNKFFASLYRRAFKAQSSYENYFDVLKKFICTRKAEQERIPTESEFLNALETATLGKEITQFLLEDIEGIHDNNMSIVRLMPEESVDSWNSHLPRDKKISMKNHELLCNVLGNLTLSNEDMRDLTFQEKRNFLSKNSMVKLNQDILDKRYWGVEEIHARGKRLADIIFNRYKIERDFDNDNSELIYMTPLDWRDATYRKPISYIFEETSYPCETWKQILIDFLKLLDSRDPSVLNNLVNNDEEKRVSINWSQDSTEIRDNIFVRTDLSAKDIARWIGDILTSFDLPNDSVTFVVTET